MSTLAIRPALEAKYGWKISDVVWKTLVTRLGDAEDKDDYSSPDEWIVDACEFLDMVYVAAAELFGKIPERTRAVATARVKGYTKLSAMRRYRRWFLFVATHLPSDVSLYLMTADLRQRKEGRASFHWEELRRQYNAAWPHEGVGSREVIRKLHERMLTHLSPEERHNILQRQVEVYRELIVRFTPPVRPRSGLALGAGLPPSAIALLQKMPAQPPEAVKQAERRIAEAERQLSESVGCFGSSLSKVQAALRRWETFNHENDAQGIPQQTRQDAQETASESEKAEWGTFRDAQRPQNRLLEPCGERSGSILHTRRLPACQLLD